MKHVKKLLKAGILLAFLALAFWQAALVSFLCPTVSLRYDEAISREQAEKAKEYASQTGGPQLTFWTEATVQIDDLAARQITFDGEGTVAYPAEYCHGSAPASGAPDACAVSTGLAWSVWGGENVVGLELTVGDVTCRVTGVFREDAPVLVRPDSGNFTAVELENVPPGDDSYRYAENFAYVCGLGTPDEILWGPGFAGWMRILPWIPVMLCAVPLARYGKKKLEQISPLGRRMLVFGLLFAAALALPALLNAMPPWLLPTRWSDFAFWSRLWNTVAERCRDFLALDPQSRDVRVKIAMAKVICCTLGACTMVKIK